MHGFKPAAGRGPAGFKNGGPIRGPGTGTSDSIDAKVPPGTYIMPADSTEKLGERELDGMGIGFHPQASQGSGVPVRLSDGEYSLPPDQVHAIGVETLNQMKGATHAPVPDQQPQGFDPQLFFANGGEVQRREPVVGTRSPLPAGTGGGLSADAVSQATAKSREPEGQPQKTGVGALRSNPVTDPQGVLRDRLAAAGFANGGVVLTDPEMEARRRSAGGNHPSPTNIFPGNVLPPARQNVAAAPAPAPAPAAGPNALDMDPQVQRDRSTFGKVVDAVKDGNARAGAAIADVATLPVRAVAGAYDTAIARPLRAAGVPVGFVSPHLVPDSADVNSMTPFYDEFRKFDAAQEKGAAPAVPGAPSAAAAPAPAATAAPAATPGSIPNDPSFNALRSTLATSGSYGFKPGAAVAAPSPGETNNVTRVGNTYSGQDITEGFKINGRAPGASGGQPSAQSQIAAQTLADRSAAEGRAVAGGAPAGFQPGGIVGINGGGVGGPASADKFRSQVALSNAQGAVRDALSSTNSRVRAAGLQASSALQGDATQLEGLGMREVGETTRTGMRETGDTNRMTLRDSGDTARAAMREAGDTRRSDAAAQIARGRLDLDRTALGFQAKASERLDKLQEQYQAATTQTDRTRLAQQIREISGREVPQANKYTVVPGGEEFDAQAGVMRKVPARVLDNQTGRFVDQPAQALPPIAQNPQALKIKNDTTMTREQRKAALADLGYQ